MTRSDRRMEIIVSAPTAPAGGLTEDDVAKLRCAVYVVRELHDEYEQTYRDDSAARMSHQLGSMQHLLRVCERILGESE